MCFAAIGTDTGGSVRIPAACCAVVGLKPTYGLVPTDGIIPLAWSLDHAGPIGRTAADVAALLDVLIGGSGSAPVAAMVRLTSLANHTGHPAVSVPPGTAPKGRPAGIQLIGRHYDEHRLLSVAGGLEALS